MIALSSPRPPPLLDAGGRDSVSPPPASPRPASPKLGNFSSIFDGWPGGFTSRPAEPAAAGPGNPVKPLHAPGPPASSPRKARAACAIPRAPAYSGGFLSGLDFSTIETPSGTPASLLLDTISEDESGRDDDDDDDRDDDDDKAGERDGGRAAGSVLLPQAGFFSPSPDFVVASASTSPSSSLTAVTAKAVSAVAAAAAAAAAAATPVRSPKRTPGPAAAGPFGKASLGQDDLPYPLGSVPTPMIPSAFLGGSLMSSHPVQPLSWYTKQEKLDLLELKLKAERKRDLSVKLPSGAAPASIHVFVDLSNIVIGFYNRIRAERAIPQEKKMKAPPFFFEAFARILERGRPYERRVTAGSAADNSSPLSWPMYMRQADALGYEMNILSRVTKPVPSPRLRPSSSKYAGYGPGHKKSASRGNNNNSDGLLFSDSSDDAFGPPSPPPPSSFKIGEQGVDEILHLKMCQSIIDCDPGVIVLATGDAAEAEFSDGFLKNAERALKHGWCVELLSWKMGISNAWRELERKQKGTGLFRIIELDKYAEDLLDMSIG